MQFKEVSVMIKEEKGSGGYGRVYSAVIREDQRKSEICIKVVRMYCVSVCPYVCTHSSKMERCCSNLPLEVKYSVCDDVQTQNVNKILCNTAAVML